MQRTVISLPLWQVFLIGAAFGGGLLFGVSILVVLATTLRSLAQLMGLIP